MEWNRGRYLINSQFTNCCIIVDASIFLHELAFDFLGEGILYTTLFGTPQIGFFFVLKNGKI